jgi:hypothetical protein
VDASCAVIAVLGFIVVARLESPGWSVGNTAIAFFSAAIVVAIRRLFQPNDPSLAGTSAMMSFWIFVTTIGWAAYVVAGYPPPRLADATTADVLLFPLLVGAVVVGGAAYALGGKFKPSSRIAGWKIAVTLASSALASLIVAAIAFLFGLSSILEGPLSASRLSRAEHVLRVGMSAKELCEHYPYRVETDCLPAPSYRRLIETGISLQFTSFSMICIDAGTDLSVAFDEKLNVMLWSTKPNGGSC